MSSPVGELNSSCSDEVSLLSSNYGTDGSEREYQELESTASSPVPKDAVHFVSSGFHEISNFNQFVSVVTNRTLVVIDLDIVPMDSTIEENIPSTINLLVRKNYLILGLNTNCNDLLEPIFTALESTGIQFSKFKSDGLRNDLGIKNPAYYQNGVLFSGKNNVGEVIKSFASMVARVEQVVFIGKKKESLEGLTLPFYGFNYVQSTLPCVNDKPQEEQES